MYVRKAIENLLQHKDIKRSSHHELKLACEEALKALEAAAPQSNNNSPTGPDIGMAPCLFGVYLDFFNLIMHKSLQMRLGFRPVNNHNIYRCYLQCLESFEFLIMQKSLYFLSVKSFSNSLGRLSEYL